MHSLRRGLECIQVQEGALLAWELMVRLRKLHDAAALTVCASDPNEISVNMKHGKPTLQANALLSNAYNSAMQ